MPVPDLHDRVDLLGIRIHRWTLEETVYEIQRRLESGTYTTNLQVNVAKIVESRSDPEFRLFFTKFDIVSFDGMGAVWGARLLGEQVVSRVAGIDLFERLLEVAADRKLTVFFLGSTVQILDEMTRRLRARLPDLRIVGTHHGYFWGKEEEVVGLIQRSGAQMVFVGISPPLQERFIMRYGRQTGALYLMGVGGSFDVISGFKRRAPVWVRRIGMEWAYRLIQEPQRLAGRYIRTNSRFLFLILQEHFRRWGRQGPPAAHP